MEGMYYGYFNFLFAEAGKGGDLSNILSGLRISFLFSPSFPKRQKIYNHYGDQLCCGNGMIKFRIKSSI